MIDLSRRHFLGAAAALAVPVVNAAEPKLGMIYPPKGYQVPPDAKLLWVNNRVDGTTVALDANTLAPVRLYRVPGGPDCIDFAPDGKLWITQRFIQKVGILDPATGALQSVPVGRSPHGIFLTNAARGH